MLSMDAIEKRRIVQADTKPETVVVGVRSLYGLSRQSVSMPLGAESTVDSGQVAITIDPEADQSGNVGLIDFQQRKMTVRYAVQAVFPGLYSLAVQGAFDPSLLAPVRIVATDDCDLTPDATGWHALGCLEFLQGSVWSGATGG
jgi:hypothetical protein